MARLRPKGVPTALTSSCRTRCRAACIALSALTALSCDSLLGADFDEAHVAEPTPGDHAPEAGANPMDEPDGAQSGSGGLLDLGTSGATGASGAAAASGGTHAGLMIPDHLNSAGTAGTPGMVRPLGAAGTPDAAGAGGAADSKLTACDMMGTWASVASAQPPTDGRIPVQKPTSRVGIVTGPSHPPCDAALISSDLILAADCALATGDTFSLTIESLAGNAPASLVLRHDVGVVQEGQSGLGRLAQLKTYVPFGWAASLPCMSRAPLEGEHVVAVSHVGDGVARSTEFTLELSAFDDLKSVPETVDPGRISIVFDLAGQLLAFCAFEDSCGSPSSCVSLATLVDKDQIFRGACAMGEMLWGDATGDGRADGVVINRTIVALHRTPNATARHELWISGMAFGSERNMLADFDGDQLTDLVNINYNGVAVRRSNGFAFEVAASWTNELISGSLPISAADVDGNGLADLVALRGDRIQVWASTGTSFKSEKEWARDVGLPVRALSVGDVDGDGRGDAIIARRHGLSVALSTGSRFATEQLWLSGVDPGAPGWFFADLNGDGRTDAVAIDATGSRVFLSDGAQFLAPVAPWTAAIPLGERGNAFADITGDGKADALVMHDSSTLFYASLGDHFADSAIWLDSAYFGGLP